MATQILPRSDVDLFSDEVLLDPYPHYRALREAAPVVYLEHLDAYAVTRFEHVRTAMRDWKTFSSAHGVGFNDTMNSLTEGVVLTAEPPAHDQLRAVLIDRLKLSSVRELAPMIERKVEATLAPLVERGTFDAVADYARVVPPVIVGELVGIPQVFLDKFVEGSEATFTVFGPMNARTEAGLGRLMEAMTLMTTMQKDDLAPDSLGRATYEAAERGDIPAEMAPLLLWNFWGPGFHTTMSAIGNAIWVLAQHPEQYDLLRADPSLIPAACNETLRYESPIQVWGRTAQGDVEIEGITIPDGARIALGVAAAHRDDRHYANADTFDIRRDARDHLAFGHGIHICLGASLARLEIETAIKVLVRHAARIEAGEPVRHLNNTVRSLDALPVTVS